MAAEASRVAFLALALILARGGEGSPRSPGLGELDPARVPWTRLRFEARKLFFKATTEVRFATGRRRDLEGQLIASPRGAVLEPAGPRISLLELDSSLAGRRSESAVWFDPGEVFALQRRGRRHGKKAYQKTYRFTRDGVFSHRRAPTSSAEARHPPTEWGKVEETFYPHPGERSGCPAVIEPAMLFYVAAAAPALREPLSLCAFSHRVLSRVELRPTGTVPLEVDYVEISPGGRTHRKGEIEALRIAVGARPFGPAEEDFEFLGLKGDVELFLAGGVPVEVGGRIPHFGRVKVRLVEVELR